MISKLKLLTRTKFLGIATIIGFSNLIIGFLGGYLMGAAIEKQRTITHKPLEFSESLPTLTPTPAPIFLNTDEDLSMSERTKLLFNPNEKFLYNIDVPDPNKRTREQARAGVEYPEELKNLTDSLLQRFECGPLFHANYNEKQLEYEYYDLESDKMNRVTEDEIFKYVELVNAKYKMTPSRISLCHTEKGALVLNYSLYTDILKKLPGGGGDPPGDYYFAFVRQGAIEPVAVIPDVNAAYGACGLIALTTGNEAYYDCGGGDGGYRTRMIYAVNLDLGIVRTLLYCAQGGAKITCWPGGILFESRI